MKTKVIRIGEDAYTTIGRILKDRNMSWTDLISQLTQPIEDIAEVGQGSERIELIIKLVL